jgi:hypothetical protein
MTLKPLAVVIPLLSLSACAGGAPLATGDDVDPASCPTATSTASRAAPDAAVAEASGSSVGAAPVRPGIGLWMADGFVRDMRAAGFPGRDSYGDDFEIGDLFVGYVSYGMDIVTLNESGSLASSFAHDPVGGPTSLIVDGDPAAVGRPLVRSGNWLANFVYDGMTNVVETTNGDTTIRESPGGRVHCELVRQYRTLACAFRGVVRADFR